MDDGTKSSDHKSNLKKKRGAKKGDKEDKKIEKPAKKAKTAEWANQSSWKCLYKLTHSSPKRPTKAYASRVRF